ncbi:hypothetical protein BDY21DRAFT_10323 [Lineolata rhizophorae]|uniref:Uncharacterized protein n=1 Tax=Lineolata rhizophorae TaxID=578093 RepID=A0A6A6PEK0_9PEZI|nr:hypothetical protein BDY21DRAFT_10323 [Lineolata rhizophorae]
MSSQNGMCPSTRHIQHHHHTPPANTQRQRSTDSTCRRPAAHGTEAGSCRSRSACARAAPRRAAALRSPPSPTHLATLPSIKSYISQLAQRKAIDNANRCKTTRPAAAIFAQARIKRFMCALFARAKRRVLQKWPPYGIREECAEPAHDQKSRVAQQHQGGEWSDICFCPHLVRGEVSSTPRPSLRYFFHLLGHSYRRRQKE